MHTITTVLFDGDYLDRKMLEKIEETITNFICDDSSLYCSRASLQRTYRIVT